MTAVYIQQLSHLQGLTVFQCFHIWKSEGERLQFVPDLCGVFGAETAGLAAFIADSQLPRLLQLPLQSDPRLVRLLHLLLALGSQTLNFLPQAALGLGRLSELLLLRYPQEFQLL